MVAGEHGSKRAWWQLARRPWYRSMVPWAGAMVAECLRSEVALLGKLSGQVFRKEELWESIDTVANPTCPSTFR